MVSRYPRSSRSGPELEMVGRGQVTNQVKTKVPTTSPMTILIGTPPSWPSFSIATKTSPFTAVLLLLLLSWLLLDRNPEDASTNCARRVSISLLAALNCSATVSTTGREVASTTGEWVFLIIGGADEATMGVDSSFLAEDLNPEEGVISRGAKEATEGDSMGVYVGSAMVAKEESASKDESPAFPSSSSSFSILYRCEFHNHQSFALVSSARRRRRERTSFSGERGDELLDWRAEAGCNPPEAGRYTQRIFCSLISASSFAITLSLFSTSDHCTYHVQRPSGINKQKFASVRGMRRENDERGTHELREWSSFTWRCYDDGLNEELVLAFRSCWRIFFHRL